MLQSLLAVKSRLVKLAGELGAYRVFRALTGHAPRILMYHRFGTESSGGKVTAEVFEQQLQILARHFNVVSMDQVAAALSGGPQLPRNAIAITVDDGYRDFYEIAYPLLKRYNMPATLYAVVDFIEGALWLWWDKIAYIINTAEHGRLQIDGQRLEWHDDAHRQRAITKMVDYAITLPDPDKWRFIDEMARQLQVVVPDSPTPEYAACSWEQLRELVAGGMIVGAHTVTHPILAKVASSDQLRQETMGCKARLEQGLGSPVRHFCYPNGGPQDFSPEAKRYVQEAGYISATVAFRDRHDLRDRFELRRYAVAGNMFQFKKAVYGAEFLADRLAPRRSA